MAACHPRPPLQHLQHPQLQEANGVGVGVQGLGLGNIGTQSQVTSQQSHYPPHLLNWVYLAIADQNPPQPPDQTRSVRTFSFSITRSHSNIDLHISKNLSSRMLAAKNVMLHPFYTQF